MFRVPTPLQNKLTVVMPLLDGSELEMSLPGMDELPYANVQHFKQLLDSVDPQELITIFTHMLFERRVLLIVPTV